MSPSDRRRGRGQINRTPSASSYGHPAGGSNNTRQHINQTTEEPEEEEVFVRGALDDHLDRIYASSSFDEQAYYAERGRQSYSQDSRQRSQDMASYDASSGFGQAQSQVALQSSGFQHQLSPQVHAGRHMIGDSDLSVGFLRARMDLPDPGSGTQGRSLGTGAMNTASTRATSAYTDQSQYMQHQWLGSGVVGAQTNATGPHSISPGRRHPPSQLPSHPQQFNTSMQSFQPVQPQQLQMDPSVHFPGSLHSYARRMNHAQQSHTPSMQVQPRPVHTEQALTEERTEESSREQPSTEHTAIQGTSIQQAGPSLLVSSTTHESLRPIVAPTFVKQNPGHFLSRSAIMDQLGLEGSSREQLTQRMNELQSRRSDAAIFDYLTKGRIQNLPSVSPNHEIIDERYCRHPIIRWMSCVPQVYWSNSMVNFGRRAEDLVAEFRQSWVERNNSTSLPPQHYYIVGEAILEEFHKSFDKNRHLTICVLVCLAGGYYRQVNRSSWLSQPRYRDGSSYGQPEVAGDRSKGPRKGFRTLGDDE